MWKYLRNSNAQIVLDLNPFQWRFWALYAPPSAMDPGRRMWCLKLLFIRFNLIADDGSVQL